MNAGDESLNTAVNEEQNEGQLRATVSCGELLSIAMVNNLQQSLRHSLERELQIELDASEVERADAAALQLLCAFMRDATASGREVLWREPTQALLSSAKLLQVHTLLFPDNDTDATA
jgi:ABC-type transporter Mla MlaB component